MGKTILGVDIGYDSLKLALCKNGKIKKAVAEPMPVNLMKDDRITSVEAMGELIRSTMRKNGIHARRCAMVLPNEVCYVRSITMPAMNAEQVKINIPYEFNDYIDDELKNYTFDYAMIGEPNLENSTMELMGVAVRSEIIDEARVYFNKAGLKLEKCAPIEYSYITLIRNSERRLGKEGEYCILDLGFRAIRMFMYRSDRHMVTRVLEVGLRNLDDIIAEAMSIDTHLAHTYLLTNYDDCQNQEYCLNAYNNIAVELMRAMNFYRFSNRDSELNDIWICGGGVAIPGLCKAIKDTLGMELHKITELLPPGAADGIDNASDFAMAVGITLD